MKPPVQPFRIAKLFVAVACGALLLACSGPDSASLISEARKKLDAQDYRAALIELKNAIQRDEGNTEARFLLAKTLLDLGDAAGARIELTKLRSQGFPENQLLPLLATAMIANRESEKVLAELSGVELSDVSANAELRAAVGTAYSLKGDASSARAQIAKALKLDPENPGALLASARFLMADGQTDEAMKVVEGLLAKQPKLSTAWQLKAEVMRNGKTAGPEAILATFRKAIEYEPTNIRAHVGAIDALLRTRDLDGAGKQLAELRKRFPKNPQVFYFTSLLALEAGDIKAAHESVQALLKVTPDSWSALYLAGRVEFRRGSYLQAAAHLNKVNLANPKYWPAKLLLARTNMRLAEPGKALLILQPLLDSEKVAPEVLLAAGEASLQKGDQKTAQRLFARVVQQRPGDAHSATLLGVAQMREGNVGAAVEQLKAVAASDKDVTAELVLIDQFIDKRDFDQALRWVDAIERKRANGPEAPLLRGRVELARKDRAKARQSFELALRRSPGYLAATAHLAVMDVEDGKLPEAERRLEDFVKREPKNVAARMALVNLHAIKGQSAPELIAEVKDVLKSHKLSALPWQVLARLQLDAGLPKDAVASATEGLSQFPGSYELNLNLGMAQATLGEFNLATQAFGKAQSLRPSDPEPLVLEARMHASKRDFQAAKRSLNQALAFKPNHLPAQLLLVSVHLAEGASNEALALSKKVQSQRPTDPMGWTLEGDVAVSRRQWPAAITAYQESLRKGPSSAVAVSLSRSFAVAGQAEAARRFDEEWVAAHPNDAHFIHYLADLALERKSFDVAEKFYRSVIGLQQGNASALNNLAWLTLRASKPGALEFAERAVKARPDRSEYQDTLAEVLAATGNLQRAIEVQTGALKLDGERAIYRLHLAQYLAKAGRKAEARAETERLKKADLDAGEKAELQKLLDGL